MRLPPLRDRSRGHPRPRLGSFLLRAHREGLPSKAIDTAALERLKTYDWPGNVRELENLIRRVCALYAEDLITARIVERELQDQHTAPTKPRRARSTLARTWSSGIWLVTSPTSRTAFHPPGSTTGCCRRSNFL